MAAAVAAAGGSVALSAPAPAATAPATAATAAATNNPTPPQSVARPPGQAARPGPGPPAAGATGAALPKAPAAVKPASASWFAPPLSPSKRPAPEPPTWPHAAANARALAPDMYAPPRWYGELEPYDDHMMGSPSYDPLAPDPNLPPELYGSAGLAYSASKRQRTDVPYAWERPRCEREVGMEAWAARNTAAAAQQHQRQQERHAAERAHAAGGAGRGAGGPAAMGEEEDGEPAGTYRGGSPSIGMAGGTPRRSGMQVYWKLRGAKVGRGRGKRGGSIRKTAGRGTGAASRGRGGGLRGRGAGNVGKRRPANPKAPLTAEEEAWADQVHAYLMAQPERKALASHLYRYAHLSMLLATRKMRGTVR